MNNFLNKLSMKHFIKVTLILLLIDPPGRHIQWCANRSQELIKSRKGRWRLEKNLECPLYWPAAERKRNKDWLIQDLQDLLPKEMKPCKESWHHEFAERENYKQRIKAARWP